MAVYLVAHGFPYDLSFSMSFEYLLAHVVTIGENEGGTFDWNRMVWEDRK